MKGILRRMSISNSFDVSITGFQISTNVEALAFVAVIELRRAGTNAD